MRYCMWQVARAELKLLSPRSRFSSAFSAVLIGLSVVECSLVRFGGVWWAPGARYRVLGTRYLVPGTEYLILGTGNHNLNSAPAPCRIRYKVPWCISSEQPYGVVFRFDNVQSSVNLPYSSFIGRH